MTALTKLRVPLTMLHPNLGPGWTDLTVRDGTDDMAIVEEIMVHDVYHLRGVDLSPILNVPQRTDVDIDLRDQVVLDIGANIGAFTMTCVRMGATVVAVEPEPGNVDLLSRNVSANRADRHVTIIPAAIGATAGTAYITGTAGTAYTTGPIGTTERVEVRQMTLASLLDGWLKVALLKVDTEGSEHAILTACPHDELAKVDLIVAELHGPATCPWMDAPHWGEIVEHLLETHAVDLFGRPSEGGGHLYARRYPT